MNAIGIDPSTRRIAIAALTDKGRLKHRILSIPDTRGAQRLRAIRDATADALTAFSEVAVVVVEIPWANPKFGSSFALLSTAAVLMEAAQFAHPGAIVLDMPTQSWKTNSVGHGNASKLAVMEHAYGLGLSVADQDVADAICMAQAGWERWAFVTRTAA